MSKIGKKHKQERRKENIKIIKQNCLINYILSEEERLKHAAKKNSVNFGVMKIEYPEGYQSKLR